MALSLLAEDEVHDPAAAVVRTWAAAVVEHGGVGAACFFEGIGQRRQHAEVAGVGDGLCQGGDRRRPPRDFEGYGPERVANDAAEQVRLCLRLGPQIPFLPHWGGFAR